MNNDSEALFLMIVELNGYKSYNLFPCYKTFRWFLVFHYLNNAVMTVFLNLWFFYSDPFYPHSHK